MHPVEAFLYYTAAAIPCLWGGHPVLAVTAIIDLGIAAWLSFGLKLMSGLDRPVNRVKHHLIAI